MRGMKQLLCFSWYSCVSGSGWKRKSHQKVPQRSLYLHNKNASFDSYVVSLRFKICPKGWFHGFVLIYPVLDNLCHSFSTIDGYQAVSCQLNWGRSSPFWRCLWWQAAKWNAGRLSFLLKRNFSFPPQTSKNLSLTYLYYYEYHCWYYYRYFRYYYRYHYYLVVISSSSSLSFSLLFFFCYYPSLKNLNSLP